MRKDIIPALAWEGVDPRAIFLLRDILIRVMMFIPKWIPPRYLSPAIFRWGIHARGISPDFLLPIHVDLDQLR